MNSLKNSLATSSLAVQTIGLLLLLLVGIILGAIAITLLQYLLPGMNEMTFIRTTLAIQSVFLFALPSLGIAWFISPQPTRYLGIKSPPSPFFPIAVFGAAILIIPFINLLVEWNEAMKLPEFLTQLEQWMLTRETEAKLLTDRLLMANTWGEVTSNLFILGGCAAVGEELLFRGIIQQMLKKKLHNAHAAIWITAFLFSAIHLQFYGFVPRLLLGAFFGYLFVWSGSLWLPILAHFVNNSFSVLFAFGCTQNPSWKSIETIGTPDNHIWISGLCTVLFGIIIWLLYKRRRKMI